MSSLTSSLGAWTRPSTRAAGASRGRSRAAPTTRAKMAGDDDEFTLPVTQEELAGMVGASRERVNKAIASFVRLGWLGQNDRRYVITNREQLSIRSR